MKQPQTGVIMSLGSYLFKLMKHVRRRTLPFACFILINVVGGVSYCAVNACKLHAYMQIYTKTFQSSRQSVLCSILIIDPINLLGCDWNILEKLSIKY